MKIKIVSDLHLEFSDIELKNNGCDVLILSGDIMLADVLADFPADYDNTKIVSSRQLKAMRFRNFLRNCCEDFPQVIYIAGNHEFYNGKFYKTLDILREECAEYPNLHFLEDKSVTIGDVIFIGATLWTDCNKSDPLTMWHLPKMMNDFYIIKNERNNFRRMSTDDIVARHHKSAEFIRTIAKNAPKDKKVVVISHHCPSENSVHAIYKDHFVMNGGYRSNMDDFILDNPNIVLWTHGHTHHCFNYMIGSTRVICNPRGYHDPSTHYSEDTGWDPDLITEI